MSPWPSRPLAVSPSRGLAASTTGSTLIELIVVLALIGLLFGVTVPALTSAPAGKGEAEVRDSIRLAAVRSGLVVRSDSVVALPDGRELIRRGGDAR